MFPKRAKKVSEKKRKDPPVEAQANEQPKRATSNDLNSSKQPENQQILNNNNLEIYINV